MKPPSFLSWFAIAGLAWGSGFIYNVYLGGEAHWLKGLYENKVAIAATVPSPKLIITGGSGAHYTVDSDLLADKIGQPVVNLGLDGPVGLNVILPSIINTVKPGDTVLLIPEYLILVDEDGFGDRSGIFSVAIGKPGLGGIPPKQLALEAFQLGIPSLRWATKSTVDLAEEGRFTGYYDGPLTHRGDPTETKLRTGAWWPLSINEKASPSALNRIAQFKEEVEARGGRLLLSMPWVYGNVNEARTLNNVRESARLLSQIAPVLMDEETLNIQAEPTLFADTHYHLRLEGRKLRSEQLGRELQPFLAKTSP
ncbi:MAG: hypothetical protein HC800_13945 [Phormidesmis sp. RL_2_1]|nr:hypothetical protein [Phormidesmis sp. RL_2_1]